MKMQFTDFWFLLALPLVWGWVIWLGVKSDVQLSPWRRGLALGLRLVIVTLVVLALAGAQWLRPVAGMNVYFLLDRSDSVPAAQQEAAREFVNRTSKQKSRMDRAGLIVFGAEPSIEFTPNTAVDVQKIQAVVPTVGSDLGSAIRLGTAAFPESGQKRLVLMTDGNENIGDALNALFAAKTLGATLDVLPLGAQRVSDVLIQKVIVPNQLKKGQTFEVKIFAQADEAKSGVMRIFRNDQFLGEQKVDLAKGKNLFAFPDTLTAPGFYTYDVQLEAPGDMVPQNNRAVAYSTVRGDPRLLIVSSDPQGDQPLRDALQAARLDIRMIEPSRIPTTIAELQSYDAIFLSNVAAGDLTLPNLKLLAASVRDFGTGLVCIGGDQAFGAGGYRGTPLEEALPVHMELDSKKVLPSGALVLVVHATEFPNGNAWARDIAFAALQALGPQDEMGIALWDGSDRWLYELTRVGDKKEMGAAITGMRPGDMVGFQGVLSMAHAALKKSTAHLKHIVVFSDGDPQAPLKTQVEAIIQDKITISTVMIGGHVEPSLMVWMADLGQGRFYDVRAPGNLPQIFIKEAAVILKSAIFEEPFKPQVSAASEITRGIAAADYPPLKGYVATTPKTRAELPLLSEKSDPLLAHWQYGLGRAVAFTSDAKAKWATEWLAWPKYRQFWSQIAQWSLRKVDTGDFTAEIDIENSSGNIHVEALDSQGNFRNFLKLQAVIMNPDGERQNVPLEQTGPGRYEARFGGREVGAYLVNLQEMENGQVKSSQAFGASVNYSPEFNALGTHHPLLRRLTESGGGRLLDPDNPADNPFLHDRQKTHQPQDLWSLLLALAVILFPVDVGIRRVQLDRGEWLKATQNFRRWLSFRRQAPRPLEADESLAALLARRSQTRAAHAPDPTLVGTLKSAAPPPAERKSSVTPAAVPPPPATPAPTAAAATTTDRLLEAKRRAQKRDS